MRKPYVISVVAQSGGGKTTVVTALKERLANTAVIYWDDYGSQFSPEGENGSSSRRFLPVTDEVDPIRDINEWAADRFNCNEWNTKPVAIDIERLLKEPLDYIILDYPFGYLNECVGKYIDLTVFIDTPLDVALAWRIIRDYTSRSQESDFGLADIEELSFAGLDEELRWYLTNSRPTYAKLPEMHKPVSDLIMDGTKLPEEIVDEIINFINQKRKNI
jgi:uridine kinase